MENISMTTISKNMIHRNHPLNPAPGSGLALVVSLFLLVALAIGGAGCQSDDCVNCVELPAPVVPTGVHSISGDNEVIVQWYDIAYHPYDGNYNENVTSYIIYSRFFAEGDQNDPSREFFFIGEVAWNQNFDAYSGLHWFIDEDAVNGQRYEYAVTAVNADGRESALSFEFVIDAPLPISSSAVRLWDSEGDYGHLGGFDFSALEAGRVDPGTPDTTADVKLVFDNGIPYLQTTRTSVHVQDFGVFLDPSGNLVFEGVSWAPADGYSSTGRLELIVGHIYVVEIVDYAEATIHYAKLGVVNQGPDSVWIHWAYQTIAGLPELSQPAGESSRGNEEVSISL